jgi:hypothetical protein
MNCTNGRECSYPSSLAGPVNGKVTAESPGSGAEHFAVPFVRKRHFMAIMLLCPCPLHSKAVALDAVWYAVAMIEPPPAARRGFNLRNALFCSGVLLLAYGGPTALLAPYPWYRESYLQANTWPLLAIALSLALFVIVAWFKARSGGWQRIGVSVFNTVCLGLAAVSVLWGVLFVAVAIINSVLGALGYHASSAL